MKENRTVVPKDFLTAVKDIKLAILQARARAAQMSNAEALKLYFFVGGYISKKTRKTKWGSGAINALSDRLQVELPGLRGFSPQHIRFMRQFYEEWSPVLGVTGSGASGICYLPSSESKDEIRYLTSSKSGQVSIEGVAAFLSVGFTHHRSIFGKCKSLDERWYYIFACAKEHWSVTDLILLCEKMNKPFVQFAVQDFSKPIGIATYQTFRTIPKPYRELGPVIEGVRKALMESPEAMGSAGR